jgi:probable rRNA maturation factor
MATVDLQNRTRTAVPEARLRDYARRILELIPAARHAHVDITLVGERCIRGLNARYRGKDAVTDVLSFRLDDEPEPGPFGTLVICARYAAAAARGCGMSLEDMLRELILHGLLHLTGSDHETATEHRAMERRRKRIMENLEKTDKS